MTTIHQLPKEILQEILKNLQSYELFEAQNVCRSWYLPAHLLYLKNINLGSEYEIEEFIQSIDHNANASYIASVQEIEIRSDDGYGVDYQFDNETMEKLFYRFPNLRRISIDSNSSCFDKFNEETCQILEIKCPKLYQFEVYLDDNEDEYHYCHTMHRLRSLVTAINLVNAGSASEFGGIIKFLTSFPRLQRVWGHDHELSKFSYCFPIFEQLAYLQDFCLKQDYYDRVEDNFAEKHLARLSEEKQDLLIQRFSQVTRLSYTGDRIVCPNAIKFIAKYFTGLENLYIGCYYNDRRWTNYHQEVLLSHMINLSVRKNCEIFLGDMRILVVAECLPAIENKLFSQLPSNRVLQIAVHTKNTEKDMIDLRLQWPTTKQITISFGKDLDAYSTLTTLLESQLIHSDQLVFHIQQKMYYTNLIDINTYTTLFRALPLIREATLDIPPSFRDSVRAYAGICQCTYMEALTLRGTSRVTNQSMLDSFALMFPNLKALNLYYYKGVNLEGTHDYYINLANYSLERLVLDMTPFYRIMQERSMKNEFFVVQIESLEKKERYRIATDLSSATKIEYDDGKEDLCVHFIVNSLQRLEGYMCSYFSDAEEYLNVTVLGPYLKQIVLFNKTA